MRRRILVGQVAAFALLVGLAGPGGLAGDKYWQLDPSVQGDWLDTTNWLGGLPGTSDNAYIDNGGSVSVVAGNAQAWYLLLGNNSSGQLELAGGDLGVREMWVGVNSGSSGHCEMSSGSLLSEYIQLGNKGGGTFTQSGGDVTLNGNGWLMVGYDGADPSWYSMEGGTLTGLRISVSSGGCFYHRAGTVTLSIEMNIGTGSLLPGYYELDPGARLQGGRLAVGSNTTGSFVQKGGDASFTGLVTLGNVLGSTGTWQMEDGTFSIPAQSDIWVGYRGRGEFVQTGGRVDLHWGLLIGWDTTGDGSYVLSGGSVDSVYLWVGRSGHGVLQVEGGRGSISSGSYQQNSKSELISQVDASGLSTIEISGAAALNGTWTLLDAGAENGRFDVLHADGGITGSFATVKLPDGTWTWGIDSGTTLWAQHVPEPATLSLLALGGSVVFRLRRRRGQGGPHA